MGTQYDWIAVGSGASGLASALWAAHRGLKAIVLEKASVVGGATGISDSDQQGVEYLRFREVKRREVLERTTMV